MQILGVMLTHKMCETCSINIQLSTRLPSPKFLKQFSQSCAYFTFWILIVKWQKALWTLFAVPNKMLFFMHLYIQRLNTASLLYLWHWWWLLELMDFNQPRGSQTGLCRVLGQNQIEQWNANQLQLQIYILHMNIGGY